MPIISNHRETILEKSTRLLGLFFLTPLMLLLAVPVAVNIAQKPIAGFSTHELEIVSLDPGGPAERMGLKVGDSVIRVNGQPVSDMATFYAAMASDFSENKVHLTFIRDNNEIQINIPLEPASQSRMIRLYSIWVAGLAFLLIGWWVHFKRYDTIARNFFALCFIFSFFFMDTPDMSSVTYMHVKEYSRALLQLLLPAYFLRFFLQFPSPKLRTTGEPTRYRLLLIPGWVLFLLVLVEPYMPGAATSGLTATALSILIQIYYVLFFVSGLVIFGRRAMRRDKPIQRTKMIVILLGLVCGLAPFLAANILGSVAPDSTFPYWQYMALSMLLVPVSFGLAIMRYGALDVAFVVRTSLVYIMLTLCVLTIYLVAVIGLGAFLTNFFQVSAQWVLLLITAASSLLILPMRRLVQAGIDNTFYPSRRANRAAINALAEDMAELIDIGDAMHTLLTRLDGLFRPVSITLYLATMESPHDYIGTPVSRPGIDKTKIPLPLPHTGSLATLLDRIRRPVFAEELEDLLLGGGSDTDSLEFLTRQNASLLVPLITGNRLLGFLLLGEKTNDQLYSQEDLANFRTLAIHAAPLLDSRLLYQQSLGRKKFEAELEVARDIQARLLPTTALETDNLIVSGRNEPCRMVGGDYFDYFLLEDGSLALAIADVAGKGVPAAMMMASVQTAFKQQVINETEPQLVISQLNKMVASMNTETHFICFFFGIWDQKTGVMSFCNAGMDPPVLMRPSSQRHQNLRKGGPVLGVIPDFPYRQGRIKLQADDRLFLYTDGLTEERDRNGEFFDLDRLIRLVENNLDKSPGPLLDNIFSQVNAFGGPEKSDDKTAIVLEIKKLLTKTGPN